MIEKDITKIEEIINSFFVCTIMASRIHGKIVISDRNNEIPEIYKIWMKKDYEYFMFFLRRLNIQMEYTGDNLIIDWHKRYKRNVNYFYEVKDLIDSISESVEEFTINEYSLRNNIISICKLIYKVSHDKKRYKNPVLLSSDYPTSNIEEKLQIIRIISDLVSRMIINYSLRDERVKRIEYFRDTEIIKTTKRLINEMYIPYPIQRRIKFVIGKGGSKINKDHIERLIDLTSSELLLISKDIETLDLVTDEDEAYESYVINKGFSKYTDFYESF